MEMTKYYNEKMEKDIKKQMNDKSINYNRGKTEILYSYYSMTRRDTFQSDTIIVDGMFLADYMDGLKYLKQCGVKEIVITDKSTGLMELLHYTLTNGGEVLQSTTVETEDKLLKETTYKLGLRVRI